MLRDCSHRLAAAAGLLLLAAATALPQQAPAPTLPERIDAILARDAAARTHWGVLAVELDGGTTLYERNSGKLFSPASNVKLVTTALALARLGPDHQFFTTVVADGPIGEGGRLAGDLRLVGGGDPNLSSRILPQRGKPIFGADRLAPLRDLARQVREAGVLSVGGDVVGDDSRYVRQPYPPGWSWRDTLEAYGSRASALAFNDNMVAVRITPGEPGAPARVAVVPDLAHFRFLNRTLTSPQRYVSRTLSARRGPRPPEVVLSGHIPVASRGRTLELAAIDSAKYAAEAFRMALEDLGVAVEGDARARHQLPDGLRSLRSATPRRAKAGKEIARRASVPLAEAVRVVNKESENLHAEMLLREVALLEAGLGSQEASIASMARFMAEAGVSTPHFFLRDGSGLSRHNLLTPGAIVRLLEHVWGSEHRQTFLDSLPVAGGDGTLSWRFQRSRARGRIRAKTGSMTHVSALSGYASSPGGTTVAFSIFANHSGLASDSARRIVDELAGALAQ